MLPPFIYYCCLRFAPRCCISPMPLMMLRGLRCFAMPMPCRHAFHFDTGHFLLFAFHYMIAASRIYYT